MLENESCGDDSVELKMHSMNDPIASVANVERAYWEKLETPKETVFLAKNLILIEYGVLTEMYCRQLSKLKLEFEFCDESRPDWEKIIVRAL